MSSTRGSIASSHALLLDGEDESASDRYQGVIQICPHQVLIWERFHIIANLPNIKTAKDVEALTKLSSHHGLAKKVREFNAKLQITPSPPSGHYIKADNLRGCSVKTSERGVYVVGTAFFTYQASEASEVTERPEGFVLNTTWVLQIAPGARVGRNHKSSKEKLRERLEDSGVWLCPHNKLSDSLIVDRSWECLHPSEDPAAIHGSEGDDEVSDRCKKCQTEVTVVRVKHWRVLMIGYMTRRYLGEGQSPNDRMWREQCGLPSSEGEE